MKDFYVAMCLVLVIEGLLYAAFPDQMRTMLRQILDMEEKQLRYFSLIMAVIGVMGVWVVKTFS